MITETLDLLRSGNFYGCSDVIEIAKGKNAIRRNWKGVKEQIRRYKFMLFTKKY